MKKLFTTFDTSVGDKGKNNVKPPHHAKKGGKCFLGMTNSPAKGEEDETKGWLMVYRDTKRTKKRKKEEENMTN